MTSRFASIEPPSNEIRTESPDVSTVRTGDDRRSRLPSSSASVTDSPCAPPTRRRSCAPPAVSASRWNPPADRTMVRNQSIDSASGSPTATDASVMIASCAESEASSAISQSIKVMASSCSASTASHGSSEGTVAASSSSRRITSAVESSSPVGTTIRSPPSSSARSPPVGVANVSTPSSRASDAIASWPGPIHMPPASTAMPSSNAWVKVRPPTRSRASSTRTSSPCRVSSRAAVRPDSPAPITTTSCIVESS